MKTIQDLTPEIKNKISIYKENTVKSLYNGEEFTSWKRKNTVDYVEYVYKLANQKQKPVVIIAENILQYKYFYNAIFNKKNKKIINLLSLIFNKKNEFYKNKIKLNNNLRNELSNELNDELNNELNSELRNELYDELNNELNIKSHYLFLISEYSRVYLMWYCFIMKEFNIKTKKEKELTWLYNNINKANIAKGFFTKHVVLILRMPQTIQRNSVGFHSTTQKAAIEYSNQKINYINGRKINNWIFDKYFSKTLTFDDFILIENEDEKAGIITLIKENEGNEGLLKFLNAVEVDSKELIHDSGHIETIKLFKTKEKYSFLQDRKGNFKQPYAWTQFICPSTNQSYLIDTSADFTDVVESAKFHRPSNVPSQLTYNFNQFNN